MSNSTNASGSAYEYRVQEDPFFTFAYPAGMSIEITADKSRNTYQLTTAQKPPVTFLVTSSENVEWQPLSEQSLAGFEKIIIREKTREGTNLTAGTPIFKSDNNLSSYFTTYLDQKNKELIYATILSNSQSVISAILTEPAGLYNTEYGNFTLRSLLSITPRENEKGFTLVLAGNDKRMGEMGNKTVNGSVTKDIAYDPYYGLYYDTETGYYYIPEYGVFFDPKTGDYYYPSEFGDYNTDYFSNYSGMYDPYATSTSGGYYDNLYSGYSGTSSGLSGTYTGYDASDIISDVYTNRQNTYDAANAMWDDYIRGDQYYAVDSSGYTEPIDTIQEYQESGLS